MHYNRQAFEDASDYVFRNSRKARTFRKLSLQLIDETLLCMYGNHQMFCGQDDKWNQHLKSNVSLLHRKEKSVFIEMLISLLLNVIIELLIQWWRNRHK